MSWFYVSVTTRRVTTSNSQVPTWKQALWQSLYLTHDLNHTTGAQGRTSQCAKRKEKGDTTRLHDCSGTHTAVKQLSRDVTSEAVSSASVLQDRGMGWGWSLLLITSHFPSALSRTSVLPIPGLGQGTLNVLESQGRGTPRAQSRE